MTEKKENVIVVSLDVQGTLNGIDDKKANLFMQNLERIRKIFHADKVLIQVSSHVYTKNALIPYLEILARNILPTIYLEEAVYLFGTYNFYTKKEVRSKCLNSNKIKQFEERYFSMYPIVLALIIDDSISFTYQNQFEDLFPVVLLRPSNKEQSELEKKLETCYSSSLYGFDGVLECLQEYMHDLPLKEDRSRELNLNKKRKNK